MGERTKGVLAWPVVLAAVAALLGPGTGRAEAGPAMEVIVAGRSAGVVAEVVEAHGGTVTSRLDVIGGVAATLPPDRLAPLRRAPAVSGVTPDQPVQVQGVLDGGGPARSVYRATTGAASLVGVGLDGAGVTVALVDTGVADVPDLAGRVVPVTDPLTGAVARCVELSGEGHCDDSYGHGTFLAGIIAGDGTASDGRFTGMAPGADLVSLKVAGRDGSSDVSTVLAAIQWAVENAERHGIRVLNLSLGTDSTQSWEVDPFNYAVQRAWDAGITVVVSASNLGPAPGTIAKPADDPRVLTVGAVDDRGTAPAADDHLPDFSARGPTAHGVDKPDVAAPGARLVSLRAPGSAVDEQFPATVDPWHRRGSGTSMAAAVVTGGVALLLEQHPGWSPDQVKEALRSTAQRTGASRDPLAVGAGVVDLAAAAGSAPGAVSREHPRSSGMGSLDASRGSVHVGTTGLSGTVLDGALTAQLLLWDPIGYSTGDWGSGTLGTSTLLAHRWHATTWHGNNWNGNNWQGNNWQGNNWHGAWSGSTTSKGDSSEEAYGEPWLGAAWYGLWG
jgi:serine protease AprX